MIARPICATGNEIFARRFEQRKADEIYLSRSLIILPLVRFQSRRCSIDDSLRSFLTLIWKFFTFVASIVVEFLNLSCTREFSVWSYMIPRFQEKKVNHNFDYSIASMSHFVWTWYAGSNPLAYNKYTILVHQCILQDIKIIKKKFFFIILGCKQIVFIKILLFFFNQIADFNLF